MAIPKTRSAREKSIILSPQNNPRFPLKNIFTTHSLCTSLCFGTFIVHKPLSKMHCGQISPQFFLACKMMEYACGRSMTGAGNCVVELKSICVLGTLVYVILLRNNLTYTTLLNDFSDCR